MATVNKDFKIKSGLIVEGTTATVNGYDILTKNQASQDFIVDIIGGETLITSVESTQMEVVAGELNIKSGVFDVDGAADTAEQNAKDYADGLAGNYDAAGAAGAVASDLSDHISDTSAHGVTGAVVGTTDAQTLTNKTIGDTLNFTGAGAMTINSDSHIVLTPASGSSVKWGSDILATQTYADQAQTDAEAYADSLATNYDAAGSATSAAAQALSDANDYTDTAVSNLVDSAPDLLNTLGELATALQENPDIISDLQDIAAGKQDTLTPGSNIDITGSTISVTGLDSADISDFNTAALSATSSAYDVSGAAASAYSDAVDYADGLASNYDAAGAASSAAATALQDAKDYADALDTDDVSEGMSNQYFTDARAKASAADLLTGATKTNITITGSGSGLTITAENGVADSDTDDLTEGSTNLYFTEQRALDAVSGSNIQPESIDITWVRRENATWTNVPTASQVVCHQAGAGEGSMKYLVRVTANVGGTQHSHVTEILATVDGSRGVAVVEYGTIYTSENPMATATVLWNALTNCYELNVTTANNNSEVMVAATMLAYQD